jgi:hypothetical protein
MIHSALVSRMMPEKHPFQREHRFHDNLIVLLRSCNRALVSSSRPQTIRLMSRLARCISSCNPVSFRADAQNKSLHISSLHPSPPFAALSVSQMSRLIACTAVLASLSFWRMFRDGRSLLSILLRIAVTKQKRWCTARTGQPGRGIRRVRPDLVKEGIEADSRYGAYASQETENRTAERANRSFGNQHRGSRHGMRKRQRCCRAELKYQIPMQIGDNATQSGQVAQSKAAKQFCLTFTRPKVPGSTATASYLAVSRRYIYLTVIN